VCRRLGGTKEALQEQGIILFSREKGMKINNWGQDFLYTRLRRIFGPNRDEVTGRRLHNKELYSLYSSPNIRVTNSRRLRWAEHVALMGERRGAYRALVGKPEGRRPLGRPTRRWEDEIKMDLREVG
jgi:hypothetical protein